MSLSKAVKFQFLAAQLTENETSLFINKLFQNHPKHINMALFNHILNVLTTAESDNINELISNIIQSRKKKPKQIQKQNIKLDCIPKPLIGVIASFLDQWDYIDFSKCNRYIYLGCNTPNLMQQLILFKKAHSSINLCLYPSIKSLVLELNKVNKLIINSSMTNASIINQLEYISLYADYKNDCDFNLFMTQNIINTNTVTELALGQFGTANNKFDNVQFIQLLTKFPNINCLNLTDIYCDFDPNDIKKLYPNLKGLTLYSSTHQINISLLQLFASNLQYLGLYEYANINDYRMDNFMFSKLEELRLLRPRIKSIDNILKTAINLQRVSIKTTLHNKCFVSSNETKTIIKKLIISCKSLEYIHLSDDGNLFESILNGMENGLFLTAKYNRKKMKIYIEITKQLTHNNNNEFEITIRKIIHWLEQSNINDFMFILRFNETNKNEIFNELKEKLESVSSNVEVKESKENSVCIVVFSNKNCNINGYDEKSNLLYQQDF